MLSQKHGHTSWALVAQSRSGSTWVNHVLASHPCVMSANEFLMVNQTARRLFHGSTKDIQSVLVDIKEKNQLQLLGRNCNGTAGGVKFKLADRDITYGAGGNSGRVLQALFVTGWRVIFLERTNYLDHFLGLRSRHRTGVLHCRTGKGTKGCNTSQLSTAFPVPCKSAMQSIDTMRLRSRATQMLFSKSNFSLPALSGSGPTLTSSRFVRVEYEQLVQRPRDWMQLLELIGIASADKCLLRDDYTKRILQTQRELILNFDALSTCMGNRGLVYSKHLQPDVRPIAGRLPYADLMCAGVAVVSTM